MRAKDQRLQRAYNQADREGNLRIFSAQYCADMNVVDRPNTEYVKLKINRGKTAQWFACSLALAVPMLCTLFATDQTPNQNVERPLKAQSQKLSGKSYAETM